MTFFRVNTLKGPQLVNRNAVVTVRPPLSTDDPKVKSVIIVTTGSISCTEEQDAIEKRLIEKRLTE